MDSLTSLTSAPALSFSPVGLYRFAAEPLTKGLGAGFRAVMSGLGGALAGASGQYPGIDDAGLQGLLSTQSQLQERMMMFSFYSNTERTKHETEMVAVRNMKLG